ncbi:hypothetical protein GJ744_008785 [Endocarpon pusillum]|uniref:Uncharacterized protein n=1 Tax=Endocarpon pusillum TaxID=364733 RepID=A0A8H7EB71_9EURO|nr:hypothetical protein GJ744_008785 [Endocarpon pusillum]
MAVSVERFRKGSAWAAVCEARFCPSTVETASECIVLYFRRITYQIPKGYLARYWNITLFGEALDTAALHHPAKEHCPPAADERAVYDAEPTNAPK